ncbi:hypothetical protein PUR29_34455 [Methylobacterium ajmalii]|uniref:Uncharacterized protein n=1 Tax=Methylobacterium ajmalii TaxID=2738439 RepID=A0ABV0A409_9HYPH
MTETIKDAARPESESSAQYRVTLKQAVSLYGFMFKPGQTIVVNEATKAAMGDAISHVEPV